MFEQRSGTIIYVTTKSGDSLLIQSQGGGYAAGYYKDFLKNSLETGNWNGFPNDWIYEEITEQDQLPVVFHEAYQELISKQQNCLCGVKE